MSSTLIRKYPEAMPFATSSGTMQFQPDQPIPAALIRKRVKARIAENLEIADARAQKKKAAAKPRPNSRTKRKRKA